MRHAVETQEPLNPVPGRWSAAKRGLTRSGRPSSGGRDARFTLHYIPTYSSWLNLVERWFAELTTKWIKRGAHRPVRELVASIRTWITGWNDDPKPVVWHQSAHDILESIAGYCQRTNDSGH